MEKYSSIQTHDLAKTTRTKLMRTPKEKITEYLSDHQRWYWKDPEHARALQRAKYKRYPEKMKALAKKWQKNNPEKWKTLNRFNSRIWYWKNVKGDMAKANQLERAKKAYLALASSHVRKEAEKSRSIVAYRAKNSDSGKWVTYTYGSMCDEPIEGSMMKDLAYSIAYLYHRHSVELYISYDGKSFSKASGALAKTFSKIMDDEFRYDEWRH